MRARARATIAAFAERTDDFEVVYASKAFPCTAALRLFAEEGLSCDVASGGELHLALNAGFDPERIYMHGNNKTRGRARAGGRRRRRPHHRRLARRDRPARADRRRAPPAGPAAGDARDPARHPRQDRHRPGGLEVRHPAGAAAAGGRALRGRRASRSAASTPTSARRSSTSTSTRRLAEVLSAAGEYPVDQHGRRLRGRLHPRPDRRRRPPPTPRRCWSGCRPGSRSSASPAARWSPTPALSLYTVGTVKDVRRAPLRRRRRRHGRQHSPDALRRRLRSRDRRPDRRLDPLPPGRHALRVRRRPDRGGAARGAAGRRHRRRARRPAPTATRWRATTTPSRGRRSSSAATATRGSWSAARPTRT